MNDFAEEIPGYIWNEKIASTLSNLSLASGQAALGDNLLRCYGAIVELGVIGEAELPLLRCWLADIEICRRERNGALRAQVADEIQSFSGQSSQFMEHGGLNAAL
jgi:hypothetical protein